jgi:flagellar hook-basal body complex protein FliE
MNTTGVDNLLSQMRAAMAQAQGGAPHNMAPSAAAGAVNIQGLTSADATKPTDFSAVLKSAIDGVAQVQNHAESVQQAFVLGDKNVSLSDVMIETQKASISLQTAIQVRNKVVTAYNDIMNMQV